MSSGRSEPKRRLPIGRLLLESFLIVFAVLLALAVDEWRETRRQRALVRAVLESVRIELDRNRQILEARLPYHESLRQGFETAGERFFVEEGDRFRLADPDRIPGRADIGMKGERGLALSPDLADTAWRTASSSGVLTSLDYDMFYGLSVAYTTLGELRRTEEALSKALDGFARAYLERESPLAAYASFEGSLEDLVLRERVLLAETRELLDRLHGGSEQRDDR